MDDLLPGWVRIVRDIGFPIAVAAYLLYSVVPALDGLAKAIDLQIGAYKALTRSVNDSLDLAEDTNHRLQQQMGEAPWRPEYRRPPGTRRRNREEPDE